ncbi:hypothetical protein RUMOBE_00038 [Blautia obeum ATCC 29174]|uniref:Uncharacterized protein n=1 Tax=Blautia obeum ATCC 29174 TaxID=411459 RepID=A5ZM20_9FIRM|nr:hypothetical protein RUMOBE_00038 [Blautia obeum ATCC 29174]
MNSRFLAFPMVAMSFPVKMIQYQRYFQNPCMA